MVDTMIILPLISSLQDAPPLPGVTVSPAAGSVAQPAGTSTGAAKQGGDPFGMMWMLIPFLVIMVLVSVMGQRRDKKRRNALMSSIRKHDEVQTSGGIIGSVVEVKDDTIVLKIDENSNVRMTFAKSAVVQVLPSSTNGQGAKS